MYKWYFRKLQILKRPNSNWMKTAVYINIINYAVAI